MLQRPTEDVDLFSDREGSVPAAIDLVVNALLDAGIDVATEDDDSDLNDVIYGLGGHMVELTAFRDADDQDGVRLSLGHLSRAHGPVLLDVGPVLHLDDLRAWKVAALIGRAEPRDLVDVGAFLTDYTPTQLIAQAHTVDPGFEDEEVQSVSRRIEGMPDYEFANYGLDAAAIAELRRKFEAWPGSTAGQG